MPSLSIPLSQFETSAARRSPRMAQSTVFLPKEHGSWSLALEPLALGLLVAPSPGGVALLAAALAGFFARRPARAAFAERASATREQAREVLCMLTALVLAGGFEMLVLGAPMTWWPLSLTAPFALLFGYFDAQGEGRAAAAEVAGSAVFAILPATFATLAGWTPAAALSLAVVAFARSVPTVLTIRGFLRQRKGERVSPAIPLLAALTGVVVVAWLIEARLLPGLVGGGVVLLAIRSLWLVGPWRPAWTARRAGMVEAILGVAYLFLAAWAYVR